MTRTRRQIFIWKLPERKDCKEQYRRDWHFQGQKETLFASSASSSYWPLAQKAINIMSVVRAATISGICKKHKVDSTAIAKFGGRLEMLELAQCVLTSGSSIYGADAAAAQKYYRGRAREALRICFRWEPLTPTCTYSIRDKDLTTRHAHTRHLMLRSTTSWPSAERSRITKSNPQLS